MSGEELSVKAVWQEYKGLKLLFIRMHPKYFSFLIISLTLEDMCP